MWRRNSRGSFGTTPCSSGLMFGRRSTRGVQELIIHLQPPAEPDRPGQPRPSCSVGAGRRAVRLSWASCRSGSPGCRGAVQDSAATQGFSRAAVWLPGKTGKAHWLAWGVHIPSVRTVLRGGALAVCLARAALGVPSRPWDRLSSRSIGRLEGLSHMGFVGGLGLRFEGGSVQGRPVGAGVPRVMGSSGRNRLIIGGCLTNGGKNQAGAISTGLGVGVLCGVGSRRVRLGTRSRRWGGECAAPGRSGKRGGG